MTFDKKNMYWIMNFTLKFYEYIVAYYILRHYISVKLNILNNYMPTNCVSPIRNKGMLLILNP